MTEVLRELLENLRECATATESLKSIELSKSIRNLQSKLRKNLRRQRREEERLRSRLTVQEREFNFFYTKKAS